MQLHYTELENGIRLIKLEGVLDLMGVGIVESKLTRHSEGEKAAVILDLSGVTFIASIGIRLIITTTKSVANRGGKLVILNPRADIRDILELTGLEQIIPIYERLEEAKRGLTA